MTHYSPWTFYFLTLLFSEIFIYFYFLYILAYPRILIFEKMAYRSISISRTGIRIRVSGHHSLACAHCPAPLGTAGGLAVGAVSHSCGREGESPSRVCQC